MYKNKYSKERERYKKEVANYIKEYPIVNYNKQWKFYVLLSYKSGSKPSNGINKRMRSLYNRLSYKDSLNFGIYVNEYGSYKRNPHHHLYLYNDMSLSENIYRINSYWKHVGISKVDIYDDKRSIYYSTKQLGETEFNNFYLFE